MSQEFDFHLPAMNRRRSLAVAAVIALLAIIGWRPVTRLFFLGSGEPPAILSATTEARPASAKSRTDRAGQRDLPANYAADPVDADDSPRSNASLAPGTLGVSSQNVEFSGPLPPIHFIRSTEILAAGQPSPEALALLLEAVRTAAGSMEDPGIVLDLDGLATSESPFLLHAKPEFDLTGRVKDTFLRLQAEAGGTVAAEGADTRD